MPPLSAGVLRQVRLRAGPRVPQGRARRHHFQVLNILRLPQICCQRYDCFVLLAVISFFWFYVKNYLSYLWYFIECTKLYCLLVLNNSEGLILWPVLQTREPMGRPTPPVSLWRQPPSEPAQGAVRSALFSTVHSTQLAVCRLLTRSELFFNLTTYLWFITMTVIII